MYKSAYVFLILFFISSFTLAIEVDGKLDEAEWQSAKRFDLAYTISPLSAQTPEHETTVKIWSDEKGIYIGIENEQPASSQRSVRVPRDSGLDGDSNNIILDFDDNKVAAYGFSVGNGGSIQDGIWSDEREFSDDWDGNWVAGSHATETHWNSEVFIPWDVAPMVKVDDDIRSVGIYVSRRVNYLNKFYASVAANDNQALFLSAFPSVSINNFSASSLKAFVSLTAREDFLENEDYIEPSLDVFWQPDSSKQVSLTLNPDFGQVESDNLVVNFSPDEVFFSEKRPFFTENQSLFDVSGPLDFRAVHTRRIGGPHDISEEAASIDGALKFTSNGSQLNYGFFAVAEEGEAQYEGRKFYVGRVEKQANKFRLGLLSSFADRPALEREATSHTVDYDVNFSQNIVLRGQVSHADSSGFKEVDSEWYDEQDQGGWARLEHTIDAGWSQEFEYSHFGDEYEINDLGFLPRNNIKEYEYYTRIQRANTNSDSIVSDSTWRLTFEHAENLQGQNLLSGLHAQNTLVFQNGSELNVWGHYEMGDRIDDRITRGNNPVNKASGFFSGYHFRGKQRKHFRYHHLIEVIDEFIDGQGYHAHFHPTFHFTDNLSMVWGLHYHYRKNWLVWDEDNLLNTYTRDQWENYIDVNAHISEKQELRIKFQWISLHAEGDEAFQAESSGDLTNLNSPVNDFSLSDTALQIRYIYKLGPLSNIYLVYSRGGSIEVDEERNPLAHFSDGWRERTGDNLLFKIRYAI